MNNNNNALNSEKGFSLLEVIVVVVIMATLTVLASQSLQQAIANKLKIQTTSDDMGRVRDSLKIIQGDLQRAFHYRDLDQEFLDLVKQKKMSLQSTTTTTVQNQFNQNQFNPTQPAIPNQAGGQQNNPYTCNPNGNDPLCAKNPNRKDPRTDFIGTAEEMNFVTMNTARISAEQTQANFVEVRYRLESCKNIGGKTPQGKCLVREESTLVDSDITKGGQPTVLLENVSEFKLRYIAKGKQDWVSTWDSKQGQGGSKDKFPEAVEVSLTTEKGEGDRKKKISMQTVVGIRFPNNPDSKNDPNQRSDFDDISDALEDLSQ